MAERFRWCHSRVVPAATAFTVTQHPVTAFQKNMTNGAILAADTPALVTTIQVMNGLPKVFTDTITTTPLLGLGVRAVEHRQALLIFSRALPAGRQQVPTVTTMGAVVAVVINAVTPIARIGSTIAAKRLPALVGGAMDSDGRRRTHVGRQSAALPMNTVTTVVAVVILTVVRIFQDRTLVLRFMSRLTLLAAMFSNIAVAMYRIRSCPPGRLRVVTIAVAMAVIAVTVVFVDMVAAMAVVLADVAMGMDVVTATSTANANATIPTTIMAILVAVIPVVAVILVVVSASRQARKSLPTKSLMQTVSSYSMLR